MANRSSEGATSLSELSLHMLLNKIRAVTYAIRDEGIAPAYHRSIMNRHRIEWPTLWYALDELLREYDAQRDGN